MAGRPVRRCRAPGDVAVTSLIPARLTVVRTLELLLAVLLTVTVLPRWGVPIDLVLVLVVAMLTLFVATLAPVISEQIAAITPLNVAWPRGAAGSHPATFDERAVTCGWRAFWGEA